MSYDFLYRCEYPLLTDLSDFSYPDGGLKARHLIMEPCGKQHALELNLEWHSRLPKVQKGPWKFAFKAHYREVTFAIALWHNPSSRELPQNWLELRRLACADDAPKNTASRFLSYMVHYFRRYHKGEFSRCISYQDAEVHKGTIYKAANWHMGHVTYRRMRDRSFVRKGTKRPYRVDMNGPDASAAEKIRWEIGL